MLRQIGQIHALSKEQALRKLPVELHPVVTYFDPIAHNLFLNDATGGIWMGWHPEQPKLVPGDLLEFSATTNYTFAPDVAHAQWKVIGRAAFPRPRAVTYQQMIGTGEDSQWVVVEGVVRQLEFLHRKPGERVLWMDMAMTGDDIDIEIPWDGAPLPNGLIDARVRIQGICGAEFNPGNQMVGVTLYVPGLQQLEVLEPAPPQTLNGPPTAIASLQRFGYRSPAGHRLKISGTVTLAIPAQGFYVQDSSGGTWVVTRQSIQLAPGDQVEALGFVGVSEAHVRIEDAFVRSLGRATPPAPRAITPDEAMSGRYDAMLVTLPVQILARSALPHEKRLLVSSGPATFLVVYPADTPDGRLPAEGARVQLTGVYVPQIDDLGQTASFRVLVRGAADLRLLASPPWWTLRRVAFVLAFLMAAGILVLIWAVSLRRRVRQQTRLISRQLAEEESLKRAAQAASRVKTDFLANMSHEIRTPMNAVVGFTDLLRDTPLTEEQLDYVETIQFSSRSLTRILNDVLDFSKIEAGHLQFENVSFPVSACVTRVMHLIAPEAHRKGVETAVEIGADVREELMGDPYRLHQVLLNLLNNALKFTDKGAIRLAVQSIAQSEDSVELQFSVSDTGIGIPPEAQEHIFDSFSQADNSTTRKYGGTGLGLAICARLVAMFGGRIWLESTPGAGSTFHFTARFGVPALAEAEAGAPPAAVSS